MKKNYKIFVLLAFLIILQNASFAAGVEDIEERPGYSARSLVPSGVPIRIEFTQGQRTCIQEYGVEDWESSFNEEHPHRGFSHKIIKHSRCEPITVGNKAFDITLIAKSRETYPHLIKPSLNPWIHDDSLHISYKVIDIFLRDGEKEVTIKENVTLPGPHHHTLEKKYYPDVASLHVDPHVPEISLEVQENEWWSRPDHSEKYEGISRKQWHHLSNNSCLHVKHVDWDHDRSQKQSTQIIRISFHPPNRDLPTIFDDRRSSMHYPHIIDAAPWRHFDELLKSRRGKTSWFRISGCFDAKSVDREWREFQEEEWDYKRLPKKDKQSVEGGRLYNLFGWTWGTRNYITKVYENAEGQIYEAPKEEVC